MRIEDYQETLRGRCALHLVGTGSNPATMALTVPVLRALEACRGDRTSGPLILRPHFGSRSTAATSTGWSAGSRRPPASRGTSARTHGARRPTHHRAPVEPIHGFF